MLSPSHAIAHSPDVLAVMVTCGRVVIRASGLHACSGSDLTLLHGEWGYVIEVDGQPRRTLRRVVGRVAASLEQASHVDIHEVLEDGAIRVLRDIPMRHGLVLEH